MLQALLIAAAMTLAAGTAAAQSDAECRTAIKESRPQTLMNICADREAGEVQDRLDAMLVQLRADLRPGRWKALERGQQHWVEYRAAHCAYEADLYRGGSGGPFVRARCFMEITENRIRELKRAVAEARR